MCNLFCMTTYSRHLLGAAIARLIELSVAATMREARSRRVIEFFLPDLTRSIP